ncbi:MAG: DNA internalization-related competence protein ComEC/Rec2 [Bacilli bacterium]
MELVKLLLIKLKLILRYRLLFVVTVLHLVFCIIYVRSYTPIESYSSKNYIISVVENNDLYIHTTKDIIFYSESKYKVGQLVSYSGECIDNKQRNFIDFEYSKYLISNNIKCSMYNPSVKVEDKVNGFYILKNNIKNKVLKNDELHFKRAIVFGDKIFIKENNENLFYNMHLAHLLALSGMHISLITIGIRFVLSKFIDIKEYVDIGVIFGISCYCLLIDYSYSVIRTFLILYLVLFFNKFNIKLNKFTIFLIVFNMVLLYNKYAIYSYSFIYSFLCYFIILLCNKYKYNFIKMYSIITLFTIAITINLNNQVNIVGLILSPVITLIFELLYFPYLLITTILLIPDTFTKYFLKFLDILYADNFNIIIKDIHFLSIFIYYMVIYYLLTIKRKINALYVLLCACVIVFQFTFKYSSITLIFFDVGQGDAMLISLDNNINILIDGGGNIFDEEKSDNIAKYTIIPYLKQQGIKKLDYIIATHGDIDHIGSFNYLINNYEYDNIFINCNQENEIEEKLNAKQLNNLNLSSKNYEIDFSCKVENDENESSIVTFARFFSTTFLSMGDLSFNYEELYAKSADILKVSHHGSNTSTSNDFIEMVNPKYVIISVGKNSYGHPSDEVLNVVKDYEVYRTDVSGAIKITISKNVVIETKLGE